MVTDNLLHLSVRAVNPRVIQSSLMAQRLILSHILGPSYESVCQARCSFPRIDDQFEISEQQPLQYCSCLFLILIHHFQGLARQLSAPHFIRLFSHLLLRGLNLKFLRPLNHIGFSPKVGTSTTTNQFASGRPRVAKL